MKLLHLIHSIDPRSGGPSHALRELVCAQRHAGHEIAIATTTIQSAEPWAPRAEFVDRMQSDPAFAGIELSIFPAMGRRRPWSRWGYSSSAARALSQRLKDPERRPDIVHIHGTFSHITSLAARLATKYDVPYIVRPAGGLNSRCLVQGSQRLKALVLKLLLSRELHGAACVHAMSQSEATELSDYVPSSRVQVIPHGVGIQPVSLSERGGSKTASQRGPCILFLSRLHPKKRAGLLIEALAQLRTSAPLARLIMAGSDAGDLANLQALAGRLDVADRVEFRGFLQGDAKTAAFQEADVFALPSVDENFGVAVVEAMAHGVPVLVTPGVATHIYVDASACGLTVEGTVDAVATGLKRLLSEDRQELGRRGREYLADHLTWPAVVAQLDEMYQRCLAEQRQSSQSTRIRATDRVGCRGSESDNGTTTQS